MTVWRFTGYYRTPRERAQRWNWRCTNDGITTLASLRTFPTFADCLADAREHGYLQHHHLTRFDRRYESDVVVRTGERGMPVSPPASGGRRRPG